MADDEEELIRFGARLLEEMRAARVLLMLNPPDPGDTLFALQIGLCMMLEKPIVVVSSDGIPIPPKLRQVADQVIETRGDLNSVREATRRALARWGEFNG